MFDLLLELLIPLLDLPFLLSEELTRPEALRPALLLNPSLVRAVLLVEFGLPNVLWLSRILPGAVAVERLPLRGPVTPPPERGP